MVGWLLNALLIRTCLIHKRACELVPSSLSLSLSLSSCNAYNTIQTPISWLYYKTTHPPSIHTQLPTATQLRRRGRRRRNLSISHGALGPGLPEGVLDFDDLVLGAGDGARDDNDAVWCVDVQDLEVLDRDALVSHVSGHALARQHT
jgi:hypothetical protein